MTYTRQGLGGMPKVYDCIQGGGSGLCTYTFIIPKLDVYLLLTYDKKFANICEKERGKNIVNNWNFQNRRGNKNQVTENCICLSFTKPVF